MDPTVTSNEEPKTIKVENLWAERINGLDIFQYIRDELNILKNDLEALAEAIATRPHMHSQEEVEGLLGVLEGLRDIYQPKGHFAKDDHTHDIAQIKNVGYALDEAINKKVKDYALKEHTHGQYDTWFAETLKTLSEYNKMIEIALETNKAQNLSINDIYKRIEALEKASQYHSAQLGVLHKKVETLEIREPVEIVMRIRDEEEFIVPMKAGRMQYEVKATHGATARILCGGDPLGMTSGGELCKVIVNKPCLVHIIFRV